MWKVALFCHWMMLTYLIMLVWGNMLQPSPFRIWYFRLPLQTFPWQKVLFPPFPFIKIKPLSLSVQFNQNLIQILPGSWLHPQSPETTCSFHTKAEPSRSLTYDPSDATMPGLPSACEVLSHVCQYRKYLFLSIIIQTWLLPWCSKVVL